MRDKLISEFERLKVQPAGKAKSPMIAVQDVLSGARRNVKSGTVGGGFNRVRGDILLDRRGNNQTMGKGLVVTLASDVVH